MVSYLKKVQRKSKFNPVCIFLSYNRNSHMTDNLDTKDCFFKNIQIRIMPQIAAIKHFIAFIFLSPSAAEFKEFAWFI